jgi:hypothetical protein
MPIKFKCPSCDQMLGIAKRKAGSVISCPRCSYPATVPAEEGEPARPAVVGRSHAPPPVFERGDFDRWIGGRRSGGSGGGAMLAEPPVAAVLPTLSESHTGLLHSHRERTAKTAAPVVDVRLAIALILGFALLAFGGGFWLGRGSAFTRASSSPAGAPNVPAKVAADGADASNPAAAPESKFVLSGVVEYKSGDKTLPDAGARIIAFPTTMKPLKKISVGGLRPGDEKGLDLSGAEALKRLGGVTATAGPDGRYSMPIPKEGSYWVLVLSRNAARPGPLNLQVEEQKLYGYFENVGALLADKEFTLVIRHAKSNEDGSVAPMSLTSLFLPRKS